MHGPGSEAGVVATAYIASGLAWDSWHESSGHHDPRQEDTKIVGSTR